MNESAKTTLRCHRKDNLWQMSLVSQLKIQGIETKAVEGKTEIPGGLFKPKTTVKTQAVTGSLEQSYCPDFERRNQSPQKST